MDSKFNKQNPPIAYYVYAHIRTKDSSTASAGSPYYIGKGKNSRAWRKKNVAVQIIAHRLTEEEAFTLEKLLIENLGRKDLGTGILNNKTDGGEGTKNIKVSETARQKIREARTGVPRTDATRNKIRNTMKALGYKPNNTEEVRKKMSIAKLGKPGAVRTPEWLANQSASRKGKSGSLKGKTYEEIHGPEKAAELRANRGAYSRGKKLGPKIKE